MNTTTLKNAAASKIELEGNTLKIYDVVIQLPHGSGIDADWKLEVLESENKVRVNNSFHALNETGYYVGWVDFYYEFDMNGNYLATWCNQDNIKALQADDNVYLDDLKDYLEQTIDLSL